jgi:hypothetical protein
MPSLIADASFSPPHPLSRSAPARSGLPHRVGLMISGQWDKEKIYASCSSMSCLLVSCSHRVAGGDGALFAPTASLLKSCPWSSG